MPRVVQVVKHKLNGNQGRWLAYHLGDDDLGSWLFHPEGTLYTGRWADGREATVYSGIPEEPGCSVLSFAPHRGGWVAAWRRTPHTAITVDLSRPVTRDGDVWGFVDLELDLWHRPGGRHGRTVGVDDDDELEDAVRLAWVTAAEAARTRDEARHVAGLILDAVHPFTPAAWDRLDRAVARRLPPPRRAG